MRWIAIFVAVLSLGGCAIFLPDRIHYSLIDRSAGPSGTPHGATPVPSGQDQGGVIAIALSGGGSRASVFGAAALEVLAEAGIAQQAAYISSVSGGGFPAAYYAIHKPRPCDLATRRSSPCTSDDFAVFKKTMRYDYLRDISIRQVLRPNRFSSPTRRLTSLQNALDHKIVRDATFGDLPEEPILLINGARYDDGRRFVFSNLAIPEGAVDLDRFSHPVLRTASFSLPGCTRAVPDDFSVALALATSAGFPPLLGPASLEIPSTCDGGALHYWHIGDGGILENTGIETIEDYAANGVGERARILAKGGKLIIFSVDAGRSTPSNQMMQTRNLKLWTTDPGRVVEIAGMRARGYREVALQQTRDDNPLDIEIISMRYTDAQLTQWPNSCGRRKADPAAIRAELTSVPTSLKISRCHADLIEMAARDVVTRVLIKRGLR